MKKSADQRGKQNLRSKMTNPRLNKDVDNNGLEKNASFTITDLPSTLLELIMCYLMLKDNIRASAVCKAWRKAAEFVRVVGKHPWVISLPKKYDSLINLFDPFQPKLYTLTLPRQLATTKVCYSKDGWLLMRGSNCARMFFFNPFTRELIRLPNCKLLHFQAAAFSSAPTSSTCMVIALRPHTRQISILSPGATEWTDMDISCPHGFCPLNHSNIVYSKDHFYCFYSRGGLLDFDVASRSVTFQLWNEPMIPYLHDIARRTHRRITYLIEERGVFFVMYTCGTLPPLMYKVVSSKWEDMTGTTDLDGLTIFASLHSSETRVNVPGMWSSVCFPKYSLSYSVDKRRYYPDKQLPIPEQPWKSLHCPSRNIWIEPPENVLEFISKTNQRDIIQGNVFAL